MSWSNKYKRSINCDNPSGFSQRAHCAARKKRAKGEKTKSKSPFNEMNEHCGCEDDAVKELETDLKKLNNTSYDSIDKLMRSIMKKHDMTAKQLHNAFVDKHNQTPDNWIKQKMNEDLSDWFGKGEEGGVGGGGWDRYNSKGERIGKCARENPSEPKPKCLSKKKANQLRSQGGVNAIANAVRRKRQQDPVADRPGKGGKPIMISNKIQEENKPTNPSLWSRAKSLAKKKFDVYPSAYANGWASKWYKSKGGGWKSVSEETQMVRFCPRCKKDELRSECKYGSMYWDMFSLPSNLGKGYDANSPHPGNFPEEEYDFSEVGKNIIENKEVSFSTNTKKISRPQEKLHTMTPKQRGQLPKPMVKKLIGVDLPPMNLNKKESVSIEDANGNTFAEIIDIIGPNQIEPIISEKCWKGYKRKKGTSEFEKGSCVKAESKKTFGEFMVEASAAWQRKEGKNPKGGLNKKGIASYRREHPGSKLSLAVTTKPSKLKKGSKKWKRRKSFCARMGGMPGPMKDEKGRPTRKALSLRKWNC